MTTRRCSTPLCSGLVVPTLFMLVLSWGCGDNPAGPAPMSAASVGTSQAAPPEPSDLDFPVEVLKAKTCEHDIPTYTCDECRYEVGVAKAPDDLFDASKGGTLRAAKVGTRPMNAGKDLNGEVRLNEERAVFLSPRGPRRRPLHPDRLGRPCRKGPGPVRSGQLRVPPGQGGLLPGGILPGSRQEH